MTETSTAKIFVLTEPEAGRFFVTLQIKGAHGHTTERVEISIGQLINCVTDGAAMLGRFCSWRLPRA